MESPKVLYRDIQIEKKVAENHIDSSQELNVDSSLFLFLSITVNGQTVRTETLRKVGFLFIDYKCIMIYNEITHFL